MKAKEILKINCNDLEGDRREVLIINPTFLEGPVMVHGTRARDDVEVRRNK